MGKKQSQSIKSYLRAAEQAYDAGNVDAALACVERGLECGATGEDRGALLSLKCLSKAWREQHDEILTTGREALSLLRAGTKPACQVLFPLAIAILFREPSKLPELLSLLLSVEPHQEAFPTDYRALGTLAGSFLVLGQKGHASLLAQRSQQLC